MSIVNLQQSVLNCQETIYTRRMPKFDPVNFAAWLEHAFRQSRFKSYSELAAAAGLKRSTVSSLVTAKPQTATGKPSRPKAETVISLAEALGQDPDEALLMSGHAPEHGSLVHKPRDYAELLKALETLGIEIDWATINKNLENYTEQDFAELLERIKFDTDFSVRRKVK